MAFYGTIPKAPDIRQQRPGYFNQGQTDFPTGFAMPQGERPFDPGANQWQNQLPDLWPEIQQELRGIMQQGRQPYYMTPEGGGQLTPEQMEHNKMLMAWKSPAGLSAIETGKYRESQEKSRNIDRAEKRVETYGRQLAAAHKAEAPKGLIQQIEKSYNSAANQLDTLLGEGQEAGYARYTGEGKFELEGMEKGPGWGARVREWFTPEDRGGELRGQEPPMGGGEPTVMQPGDPGAAVRDVTEQAGKVIWQGLLKMDQFLAKHLGSEKAKEITDQIVAESKEPSARLEQAITALPPKAQQDPEVLQLKRQLTATKLQAPGWGARDPRQPVPDEGLPILEQFQRGE